MEDRCVLTAIVNTQRSEHCGCQSECDSASRVKSYQNDIDMNADTDDEDYQDEKGFDDGSAQVRNNRDPR